MRTFAPKQNQPLQPASSNLTMANRMEQQSAQRTHAATVEGGKVRPSTSAPTRFAHDFSRIPVSPRAPVSPQAKHKADTPWDASEQEADRTSERAIKMLGPQRESACGCGGGCPRCQMEQPGHPYLQAKRAGDSEPAATAAPPIVQEVLRSAGQALDPSTRAFMEPRLGSDFSQVRVHTDGRAAESARAVNALAYTVGQDIIFGAGQHAPQKRAGRWLLAHELAHVAQQSASVAGVGAQLHMRSQASSEQEADRAATQVTANPEGRFRVQQTVPGDSLQKFSTAEHEQIGQAAYDRASSELQSGSGAPSLPPIDKELVSGLRNFSFRTASKRTFTYGQMVAQADEFASFELLEEHEQTRAGRGTRIPLLSPLWDLIGDKTSYLDLAARNRAHFHPHNFLSWQPWHWQALHNMHKAWHLSEQSNGLKKEVRMLFLRFGQHKQQAHQALEQLDKLPISGEENTRVTELKQLAHQELEQMSALLREIGPKQQQSQALRTQANDMALRAVAMNGFGDHFLTDAFAAGHIVTPRVELLTEYTTKLLGFIPVGGILHCANLPSLAWHDLDNKFGVQVNNMDGDEWLTYGDDYASEGSLPGGKTLSPTLEHVVEATAMSVRQMWQAAGGRMPADLRPVLNKVPRPKLEEYPRWSPSDWDGQLRHASGDQGGTTSGAYEALSTTVSSVAHKNPSAASSSPSAESEEKVPNPKGGVVPAICLNLWSVFSYQKFVVPMIERARRDYNERFFTGRASQIVSPDTPPGPQASVKGHVVAGSLIGGAVGLGLGLLAGGLLGGVLGGLLGLAIGGFVGGFLGKQRSGD